MNKYLAILLFFFSITMNAQDMKQPDPIDISNILSFDEFQEIKKFILDKEQTKTYGNMYNDNPYYSFDNNVNVYLNPIRQFVQESKINDPNEYDEICIQIMEKAKDYPYQYTFIKEDRINKKVSIIPYYDTEDTMKDRKQKIGKYINQILLEVR